MMKTRVRLGMLLLSAMALPAVAAAQDSQALTYDMAAEAMDAAEAEARANGWDVTIVITDADGVPVYVRRIDGASPRSYEVAMRKTATVVASGLATSAYGEGVEAGEVEEVPDGVTFAGGVPILRGGELIGAIGASGVQALQDEVVSQAGADAIAD